MNIDVSEIDHSLTSMGGMSGSIYFDTVEIKLNNEQIKELQILLDNASKIDVRFSAESDNGNSNIKNRDIKLFKSILEKWAELK